MPAFIQLFTPCNIAWGYDDDPSAKITSLGVSSGIWPMWEWGNERFRRTIDFNREGFSEPLSEYLRGQRRYAHLKDADFPIMEAYVRDLNDLVVQA